MIETVLLPVVMAGFVCIVGVLLLQKLAPSLGLVDAPQGRKQHDHPTPVIGGIAITMALFSLFFFAPELFMKHWVVFASVAVLMAVGIVDDLHHIHSAIRILIEIGVGCAIHFEGNLPFRSVGDIWFIGDLGLGPYSLTFTCIAVVGGVNAINMIDGLDGLCGWVVNAALFWLAVMSAIAGVLDVVVLALVGFSAVTAFLLFNFRFPWNPKARVFLGDSGAYVLGFFVAALFLLTTQGVYIDEIQVLTPVTALWLLFIPLVDIAGVIWRRSTMSRWPVDDDREHLHYMLVDRGHSVEAVVIILSMIAFTVGGIGVALYYAGVSESWSFVLFIGLCSAYFYLTRRRSR